MSADVGPILASVSIVDVFDKDGLANLYFQQRWEELRAAVGAVSSVGEVSQRAPSLNAAYGAVVLLTTREAGFYRVSWYLRKVVADGVNSSLSVTLGWLDNATALTETGAALATDTAVANQSGRKELYADAASDIGFSVNYASNTPGAMRYTVDAKLELIR